MSSAFIMGLSVATVNVQAATNNQFVSIEKLAKTRLGGDQVKSGHLANGMQVVVIPDHRAPVVTHMVWYHVGAADEAAGKSGIAHFLEHLMFKGTKNAPEGEFSQKVADIGGQENAFTSQDYTAYYQQVASQYLPMVMKYEADRMANLVLTKKQVDPEREVVLEERALRTDKNPAARLSESFDQMLYVNHPYGTPVIGWENEIKQLSLNDAISFYNKYYTPNNATLVVAGDVTFDKVMELANKTYGKLERRAEPGKRQRPQVQYLPGVREVILHDKQVGQTKYKAGWLVPSMSEFGLQKAAAADLLSDILGGGATSRLYQELAVKHPITTSIGSYYRATNLDAGEFVIYASLKDDTQKAQVEQETNRILAEIAKNGVTEAELERNKRLKLAATIYAQDNQRNLAQLFGASLSTGATVEQIQSYPQRIATVSTKDIQDVAKQLFAKQPVISLLQPEKANTNQEQGAVK
ncbi:M16 family metallopeptidase [Polycladidibacter stylochi]|uniref:M16 family metallopeptidase n=1 Tax=Polycladidibacter stylochi TaxID=1807766 RepID=UPI00082DE3EE|nr:pitrilysin family protein [Pseudovibrio stylochi]